MQSRWAPVAGIAIYQTPDANSLQVGKEVAAKMAQLARRFPQDLRYGIPYDTTIFIKASVDEVYQRSTRRASSSSS